MGSYLGVQKIAAKRIGISFEEYTAHLCAGEKWCTGCKAWYSRDSFSLDRTRGDGKASMCMGCRFDKIQQKRTHTSRPGQRLRREMLAVGLKWCRRCKQWLPKEAVTKNGLCRPHENEEHRTRYVTDPNFRNRIKERVHARRRGLGAMPLAAKEMVAELFDGECAYCDQAYETWDHVHPVSKGGQTIPGNMVPACRSCNSSKHNHDIETWLDRAPMVKAYTIDYLSLAGHL